MMVTGGGCNSATKAGRSGRKVNMIQTFVDKFMENREQLRAEFSERHPEDYKD